MKNKPKQTIEPFSILTLSLDELHKIQTSGTLPEKITLQGIEKNDVLFKHRDNPSLLARMLIKRRLKEKGGES